MKSRKKLNFIGLETLCLLTGLSMTFISASYPLDGRDASGIRRLSGYQVAQAAPTGPKLQPGALLGRADIRISMADYADIPDFDSMAVDESLQLSLESIFKSRDPSYSVVVIDISRPRAISWAGVQPDIKQNVGSVGKILCMLALFDSLARAYPDIEDRQRILRETMIHAGDWVNTDEHKVPIFSDVTGLNQSAIINPQNDFYLSEWIDHMVSASANAAASVVWREAMLLRQLGKDYPKSFETGEEYFRTTPRASLLELSQTVINDPIMVAGLNAADLQQGSFWTRNGKARVPGKTSHATARELARYMLRLEQGRLVDAWSSEEMKRYLYMTKRRYRYVYAPELSKSAVYFKSGSLYSCQPEEGFRCGKYMGNKRNYMNSVAIIESLPGAEKEYRYIVALLSNVLKINSAWDHSRLGAAIHQAVLTRGEIKVRDEGTQAAIQDAGQGE